MTTVKLLGEAGRQYVRELELDVATPLEAVTALDTLFPGFREYLLDSESRGIVWRVVTSDPLGTPAEDLDKPIGDILILAPIIQGKAAVGLLIAGAVLSGVGAVTGISVLLNLGLSLFFSGLASLLSPTPEKRNANQKRSFLFTASEAGTYQGTFVPLLYGETVIQSPPPLSYGLTLSPDAFVG